MLTSDHLIVCFPVFLSAIYSLRIIAGGVAAMETVNWRPGNKIGVARWVWETSLFYYKLSKAVSKVQQKNKGWSNSFVEVLVALKLFS